MFIMMCRYISLTSYMLYGNLVLDFLKSRFLLVKLEHDYI